MSHHKKCLKVSVAVIVLLNIGALSYIMTSSSEESSVTNQRVLMIAKADPKDTKVLHNIHIGRNGELIKSVAADLNF